MVPQEVLAGIFRDDPTGIYYSKDGLTFYNHLQYATLPDKSGFQEFTKPI